MTKRLIAFLAVAFVAGCATKVMETPEGIYTWKRAGLEWRPGHWERTGAGVVPLPSPSPVPVKEGGSAQ